MTITGRFARKGLYQQLKCPAMVIDCFLLRLSSKVHQVYFIFWVAVILSSIIYILTKLLDSSWQAYETHY